MITEGFAHWRASAQDYGTAKERAGSRLYFFILYFCISVFLQCIAERFPAVNTDLFKSCPFSSPRAVLSLNWRDQTVHFRLESRNMASSMIVSKVCFKMFQAVSKFIPMEKRIVEKQCFTLGAPAIIIRTDCRRTWLNSFLGSVCRHFVTMETLIGRYSVERRGYIQYFHCIG